MIKLFYNKYCKRVREEFKELLGDYINKLEDNLFLADNVLEEYQVYSFAILLK